MRAEEKGRKKAKTSKRVMSATKSSSAAKAHVEAKNIKGSVTLHLEAQKGRAFTEAELVRDLNEELQEAWAKLRAFAADLGSQRIYASALSIMFARKICYFYVRPRKTFIEVWIFLPRKIEGLTAMHGPTKKVRYCNLFKLIHADQVEAPLTDWIREAFGYAPA